MGGEPDAVRVASGLRRFGSGKVGCVVAGPPLPVPPDPLFPLTPRAALEVGRGAVVHHPAVGGPSPSPVEMRPGHARRVAFLPGGEVSVRRGEHAAVDPGCTGGGAVVLQLVETAEM